MLINAHTHSYDQSDICVLVLDTVTPIKCPTTYFCYGIHPWNINDISTSVFEKNLTDLIKNKHFFALGEIGLDKVKGVPLEEQIKILKFQLKLTQKYNIKNIVIHCVRSHDLIYKVIKESSFNGNIIFHDYNSTIEMAKQYLNSFDCYFSFGASLFKNRPKILNSFQNIPNEKILLETDDQKDYTITDIYHQAAKILDIDIEQLQDITQKNFNSLRHN